MECATETTQVSSHKVPFVLLEDFHPLRLRQSPASLPRTAPLSNQAMHLSKITLFALASVISANSIQIPSLTVSIRHSSPSNVPAGHPSSLTSSILSTLEAVTNGGSSTTATAANPPQLVSVSVEYVAVTAPTLVPFSVPIVSLGPPEVPSACLRSLAFPAVCYSSFISVLN